MGCQNQGREAQAGLSGHSCSMKACPCSPCSWPRVSSTATSLPRGAASLHPLLQLPTHKMWGKNHQWLSSEFKFASCVFSTRYFRALHLRRKTSIANWSVALRFCLCKPCISWALAQTGNLFWLSYFPLIACYILSAFLSFFSPGLSFLSTRGCYPCFHGCSSKAHVSSCISFFNFTRYRMNFRKQGCEGPQEGVSCFSTQLIAPLDLVCVMSKRRVGNACLVLMVLEIYEATLCLPGKLLGSHKKAEIPDSSLSLFHDRII